MTLNIITGNHFSQRRLIRDTNKFFGSSKYSTIISKVDSNYIVNIDKRSVTIILSTTYEEKDIEEIKEYIRTLFNGKSILIVSSENFNWLSEIKNVKIHTLNTCADKVV